MMDKHRGAMKPPDAYIAILLPTKVAKKLEMTKIIFFFVRTILNRKAISSHLNLRNKSAETV